MGVIVPLFAASVPSNAETMLIADRTGTYSPLNTGGYGSPNPDVDTALTATMGVSKRETDGTWGEETSVDMYDDLPSKIGGEFEIAADDAGQGENFADAIYRLTYNVTGDDGGTLYNVSKTIYVAFTPTIDSYWQNLGKDVAACSCSCEALTEKFNCFSNYYYLLCAAKRSGDLNGIQKYIDILTALMRENNCGC